jgi:hypothetical protein
MGSASLIAVGQLLAISYAIQYYRNTGNIVKPYGSRKAQMHTVKKDVLNHQGADG